MGRPKLKAVLGHEGFRILDYGIKWGKSDASALPDEWGVYALYYGDTLKYIGKTDGIGNNLRKRVLEHDQEFPWGNFDWFVLRSNSIARAEKALICYYKYIYDLYNITQFTDC